MNPFEIDFSNAHWLNEPSSSQVSAAEVHITTEPRTDFWQRSYYGFRADNAPALLFKSADNFSFSLRCRFHYQERYDQCGLFLYLDAENWAKASVEYEDDRTSRLGSVITNLGHSDWATTDIATPTEMHYRLSRRGPDFLLESSPNGANFRQLRIFHLSALGETDAAAAQIDPPPAPLRSVQFGLYACSPEASSFETVFNQFQLQSTLWRAHR